MAILLRRIQSSFILFYRVIPWHILRVFMAFFGIMTAVKQQIANNFFTGQDTQFQRYTHPYLNLLFKPL